MSRRPPRPAPRKGAGQRTSRDAQKPARPEPRRKHGPSKRVEHTARAPTHPKRDTRDARNTRDTRDARAPARAQPHKHGAQHEARAGHERGPQTQAIPRLPADALARLQQSDAALHKRAPLQVGEWLWTCRAGAERDVVDDLLLRGDVQPRGIAESLLASRKAPGDRAARLELTFARQGFEIAALARAESMRELAAQLLPALLALLGEAPRYALHVFVPDSTQGNLLAQNAQSLADMLLVQLAAALPDRPCVEAAELRRELTVPLLQICVYEPGAAAVGVIASDRALSLWPGGRARMRLSSDAPSRAARKLEEAFAWLGMSPGAGELCVDLGAAPGGWSWLLLERRARVIAVDPAKMDAELMQNRRLSHVQGSAFEYTPEQTVDWLFCDMAWRPLEVAQMLARWARRHYTRLLVSNFKLPMKRKAEMVAQIRGTLEAGGFSSVRARQLYHDREEITLTAHVR